MTQAVASIDPRLIQMVGRKLYSSNPLPIVVRELLQNAIDACSRKGVEPRIVIKILQIKKSAEDWLVSCEDNGIGMTDEQIVDDFLRLGGKKSNGSGQTGGFGIAKAAIMSCSDWSVSSLDNFLNKNILLQGGTIRKRSRRDGTKVTVRIKEQVWGEEMRDTLRMIYFSDVKIHLVVNRRTWPSMLVDEKNAGLSDVTRKLLHESEVATIWGVHDMKVDDAHEFLQPLGWNVVRLNGLVQFLHGSRSAHRQTNLFFDMKTDCTPDEANYPFSMSREKLVGEYNKLVEDVITAHNANVLQSVSVVAQDIKAEETVEVIPGKEIHGSRDTRYDLHKTSESSMGNMTSSKLSIEERIASLNGRGGGVKLVIYRYKKDPERKAFHAKLLLVWQDVMQVVAASDESFGIGITSDQFREAFRMNLDGTIFYVLNPELAMTQDLREQSPEAIVLALWALAAHEATHSYVDDHNEWFTTTMHNIQRDSSEVLLKCLNKIAKRLK